MVTISAPVRAREGAPILSIGDAHSRKILITRTSMSPIQEGVLVPNF